MLLHLETLGHAALAFDAILEGDAAQIALPVVGPGVVDAGKILFALAVIVEADQRAAMVAAVFEGVYLTVGVADHDDRRLADFCGAEVAGLGQFDLEREI